MRRRHPTQFPCYYSSAISPLTCKTTAISMPARSASAAQLPTGRGEILHRNSCCGSLQASDLLLLVAEWAVYSVSSTAGAATLVVEGERVPFSIVEEIGRTPRAKRPAQQRNRSGQNITRTLELTEFVQSDRTLGRLAQTLTMAFVGLAFSKSRLIFSELPKGLRQSVAPRRSLDRPLEDCVFRYCRTLELLS